MRNRDEIRSQFIKFAEGGYSSANAGTAVSYCRALDIVSNVLQKNGLSFDGKTDVWQIDSIDSLMRLYDIIVEETRKFLKTGGGVFAQRDFGGRSYIEKWWCSSSIKAMAAYRASTEYENRLADIFTASASGSEIAKSARHLRVTNGKPFLPDQISERSAEGRECIAAAKRRLDQGVFRKWILAIYNSQCCVTGISVPEVLRASHISGWAADSENRMNPSNGLCLSATYDAAFDRHLISFDDDYRMILSPSLRDYCTNDVHRRYFLDFEGKALQMPIKFLPSRDLLQRHRQFLVG